MMQKKTLESKGYTFKSQKDVSGFGDIKVFEQAYDKDGMPIGLQILAPQLQESRLFNAAHKFERANDYYLKLANI